VVTGSLAACALGALVFAQATAPADKSVPFKSAMMNPYHLVENWPKLGNIAPGPAIGIIPDGKGGVWLLHRSDPPLLHIDGAGNVVKTMGEGMFGTVHAFCQDKDGNFWAGDSGPFGNPNPEVLKKAYVVHTFSPDRKRLLTILKDDTLVVADSESSYTGYRPVEFGPPGPETRGVPRNAGWQPGIRVGSAKDGSLRYFISATRPEGMGADDQGNIFGGLTAQCS